MGAFDVLQAAAALTTSPLIELSEFSQNARSKNTSGFKPKAYVAIDSLLPLSNLSLTPPTSCRPPTHHRLHQTSTSICNCHREPSPAPTSCQRILRSRHPRQTTRQPARLPAPRHLPAPNNMVPIHTAPDHRLRSQRRLVHLRLRVPGLSSAGLALEFRCAGGELCRPACGRQGPAEGDDGISVCVSQPEWD